MSKGVASAGSSAGSATNTNSASGSTWRWISRRFRRHRSHAGPQPATRTTNPAVDVNPAPARRLATLHYGEAAIIGFFQTFALLAGISRSGIAMVGGLARGLSDRDAARFSLLLATPVILAPGVLKLPSLAGPAGAHIHGQVLVGAAIAGLASYVSVRWLTRYFETRTLTPFAIYCLVAGAICIIRFA
jgi:undecaprenyl-diphosphatase